MDENPELLATLADASHQAAQVPSFASFMDLRASAPPFPQKPLKAEYSGPIDAKRKVFEAVNREVALLHQQRLTQYAKDKKRFDVLNLYPAHLAGYGSYLTDHHPQVLDFFGRRRPFFLERGSRRLHTYIVGGSGSGKTECLKSAIWHYLNEEPDSAIVYIDPHSDAAEQVAKFKPNATSGRLAYVKPSLRDDAFPGLNPFDIDDKESLTDKDAEDYADEFLCAFREVLEGNLTDQMETVLRNTVPVIVKMPGTSVYDLIDFLRPKPRPAKPAAESEKEAPYLAQRYLDFARANFSNRVMLDFLSTQFDDDAGYVTTRNSLTTRLSGIFGTTVMQGLFRGTRTVRLEQLIRARKLVVFDLGDMKQSDLVGKFVLITLKIFAINQARVAEGARVPCHVFVDESQTMITASIRDILEQARKFQVFLTLAQTTVGARMDTELFECVLANSATKIVGANNGPSVDAMSRDTGASPETIKGLQVGQFVVYQRGANPKTAIVRMPTNTLKNRAGMDARAWKATVAEQIRTYYVGKATAARTLPKATNVRAPENATVTPEVATPPEPLSRNLDQFFN